MKKYIAEAIGTGVLTLMVGLAVAGAFPVATPVLAALVLGLFVYSVGHISGTHINPAVTIGLWSIKKISSEEAGKYIVVQFLGAFIAMLLLERVIGVNQTLVVSPSLMTGLAECLGAALFTFGIASVVYGKAANVMSGAVVGGSLLAGIAIAVLAGSNGVLNPAVALGIGSFGTMYVLGPIVGAVIGMRAYKALL